jgi:YbbR domain-containing protein
MGKKILNSKLLYALLAVVIAIGLWLYVAMVENRDEKMTISGIPITFLNEDVLEENGLMISSGRGQTATLTVTGPWSTLAKLDQAKDSISLTVDVSKITTPGEQRMAYTRTLPLGYSSSVDVINQYPNNVDFTVSRRVSRTIDVVGRFEGTLAEGYLMDQEEFSIRPGTIEITGAESDVNQVDYAQVIVTGENLNSTFEAEMGFTLIDYQGEELKNLDIQCSADTVLVTMPVLQTADVPLQVELIPGGGVTDENMDETVKCTIEPATITVSGAEEDLTPLKEIFLGEIVLANIIGSDSFQFDISLDPALENISGVTQATVTVTVSGLATKTLEADRIDWSNAPDGLQVEAVTQSVKVLVRGTEEALDLVQDHNVRVVADLSEIGSSTGRYTVPAKVYLDSTSDVGVVGNDYKVVVDISR